MSTQGTFRINSRARRNIQQRVESCRPQRRKVSNAQQLSVLWGFAQAAGHDAGHVEEMSSWPLKKKMISHLLRV